MKKKSFYLFKIFTILFLSLFILIFVLILSKTPSTQSLQNKNHFVQLTLLPDLALSSKTSYIRHRSLTDLFSIYKDDGTLREYDLSSFVYAPSYTPNKYIQKEKQR